MKRTTVLSIILLIAFFMPWADFNFLSFSGFELPKSIVQLGGMRFLFNESDADFLMLTYAIYFIPIFAILSISSNYVSLPFSAHIKKVDYYLALIFSIIILLLLSKMNSRVFSFLGIGFYLTVIISLIGIFLKDKALIEPKISIQEVRNDAVSQLTELKELLEKELISTEEYQQRKEEILRKMV
jgi:hypothetical protein